MSLRDKPYTIGEVIALLEQVRKVIGDDAPCDTPPDDRNGRGCAEYPIEVHVTARGPVVLIDLDYNRSAA